MSSNNKTYEVFHIAYRVNSIEDIVHRLSPKNYELLTDEFVFSQESIMSKNRFKKPVVTEIYGCSITPEEQETINKTVKVHYGLKTTYNNYELKKCRIKTFWFIISFIVSSLLLFAFKNQTQEVILNFAYIPFWFFGYRVFTYPLFEYLPKLNEKNQNEQLANMKIIYSKEPRAEFSIEERKQFWKENKDSIKRFNKDIKHNALSKDYFVENDILEMECNVESEEDLLSGCSINGNALITEEMALYLEKAVPFVEKNEEIVLKINGGNFSNEKKQIISSGYKTYFKLRCEDVRTEIIKNLKNVLVLTIGLIASSLMLYYIGGKVDVAYHELILILLWFFGDYLIEHIVLNQRELNQKKKLWEAISKISIQFFD